MAKVKVLGQTHTYNDRQTHTYDDRQKHTYNDGQTDRPKTIYPKSFDLGAYKKKQKSKKISARHIGNTLTTSSLTFQSQNKITHPTLKFQQQKLFSYMRVYQNLKLKFRAYLLLDKNSVLISEQQNKANIHNRKFQDAFTPITSEAIPDKYPCPQPSMPYINITENGIT
ncbi:hypothetical protein DPMN_070508 [Dreissena polymorpha]|uniref:Uncharacterized protein n=1 Tax=Dreissena polymorpha TaxID=45954 RepID=A0A9D3Z391_DREPO|nr:hypothetical protein DPMN_070508 [Dreissena polymorpha]